MNAKINKNQNLRKREQEENKYIPMIYLTKMTKKIQMMIKLYKMREEMKNVLFFQMIQKIIHVIIIIN